MPQKHADPTIPPNAAQTLVALAFSLVPNLGKYLRWVSALLLEDHRHLRQPQSGCLTIVQCHVGVTGVRRHAARATGLAVEFWIHDEPATSAGGYSG